ncbi:hypothetical protein BGZ47_005290 [Haplosporangium gracile]|nr:hypothetical protein BGZ47_005290 [Haplosporangium gracile]
MPSLSAPMPRHEAMTVSQSHGHCFEDRSPASSRHHLQLDEGKDEKEDRGGYGEQEHTRSITQQWQHQTATSASQSQQAHRHQSWLYSVGRLVILLTWISFAVLSVVDAGNEDGIFENLPLMDDTSSSHPTLPTIKTPPKPSPTTQPPPLLLNNTQPTSSKNLFIDPDHITNDDHDSMYDPPYQIPGLTHEEFEDTWYGEPNTIKIGVLLPFSPNAQFPYMMPLSRISLSVGGVIGDIASDLTTAEAIMTSSVGVPQCSFASYNMDTTLLSNFVYLFRTVPGVTKYIEALALVVKHYKWTKVSIMHTSDIPGIIDEKAFSALCASSGVEITRFPIPLSQGRDILEAARSVIQNVKNSDTRIHILAAPRPIQIPLLAAIRDIGLFHHDHVWMTTIDLTDSLKQLANPSDFNGLIMADTLWDMPGVPEYDRFVTSWQALNPNEYPMSGSSQLTWHETFTYTCMQVLAEAYKDLVTNAMALTNITVRDRLLLDIQQGKRSQDLTMKFLGSRNYSTPVGRFIVTKGGEAFKLPISISSFQHSTSVPNGRAVDDKLSIFNDIVFNSGSTSPPSDAPSWDNLNPSIRSPFGITIVVLTSLLMLAIIITAIIVVVFRENIVMKSASPLFCILELFGLAVTLSWIYLWVDLPSPATCRMGLLLVVVGLSINLSALVVKNYRIYRIFNSVSVINHAVSNRYLLRVVTIPVVITIIPCLVRCFYKYLVPTVIRTNDNKYWVTCAYPDSSIFWDIVVGAMPIIINIFGIYLAFKTRNVTRLWNEARSIATTIYLVSFFVIIIIIVQSFPESLYKVTYHVTFVSVFLASLIEYIILFYPKLRNLFLERRGLHVAAGRDDDGMDSILGGVSAPLGGAAVAGGGGGVGGRIGARLGAATLLDGGGDGGGGRFGERRFGSVANLLGGGGRRGGGGGGGGDSTQGSTSSADLQQQQLHQQLQQQQQQGHNISDLVSSYPFGQLNSDSGALPMISPVHLPIMYEPSSTLINRESEKVGAGGRGSDQEGGINGIRLPEAHRATGRSMGVNGGTATKAAAAAVAGSGGVIPPAKGYDTFVRDPSADIRNNSQDAQPVDLHDVLMPSSNNNRRSNGGLLSVSGVGGGGGGRQDLSTYDFLDTSAASDRDPYSRNNSVVEYDALGMINRLRAGNRSPKLCPLQTNYNSSNIGPYGLQSSRHPLKERRADSYTVTAPVQRQSWYMMRFLAQWRMSKIIFIPHSKLFIIVDLETEKSESLIVHTIEKGYSASDYWTTTKEAQHINTTIYPTDGTISPAPLYGGPKLPPIRSHHLPQYQQQQQGLSSMLSPLTHPTALPVAEGRGGGQSQIKPDLASNQVHTNSLASSRSLNPNANTNNSSNNIMNQEARPSWTGLAGSELSYQIADDTVLAPLDDPLMMSSLSSAAMLPTTTTAPESMSPLQNNLSGGAAGSGNTTVVGSVGGGVGPEATDTGAGLTTNATRVTIAPGATGAGAGVGGDVEEGGSSGSLRRRIESIAGFNSGVRQMSQFLGFPARTNPLDLTSTANIGSGGGGVGESADVDDTQPTTNGTEQGIISEHIIRVISIHNEVWRVQLPDPETMERWIEIGHQIKDENWISRSLAMKESSGDTGGKRPGSGGGAGGTKMKRGSSSSGNDFGGGGGHQGGRGGGGDGVNESSPEDKYEFAQRPPRRPGQQMQQRALSFHPLQSIPTSMTATSLGTGAHFGHQHLLPQPQPTMMASSSFVDNSPLKRYNPMRFDSDMTETSYAISSSQNAKRKQIREQAARINQEMRATTRYVPPLFRGLLKQQQQQQTPSVMNIPRLSGTDDSFLGSDASRSGSPPQNSLGHRIRKIPSSLSMAPISVATQKRFGVANRQDSSRFLGGNQQQGPLSAPLVTPSSRHRLSETLLPTPSPTSSPATTPDISGAGHRSSEETNIRDILAETNVSYDQGQHAVYENPLPGLEHRGYRHFNTLQYNYDAHRNSESSAAVAAAAAVASNHARRKKILMRQRRRRSAGTVGSVGTGYNVDDEDLDLDLELELDFEHLETRHAAESSPESPQWHLTSVELAKLEAENLKRNSLAGSFGSLGVMTEGGEVDDIRSTRSGGSGNSAATAHTASAPINFTTSAFPTTTTSSSAPASTTPTPNTLTPTGASTGNLIRHPLGGTRFSRVSPGVPAVSFLDAMVAKPANQHQQEEFSWQQQALTLNPVIIYSPPPPEPGDDNYQSPPDNANTGGDTADENVVVIPVGGGGHGTTTTTAAAAAAAAEAPLMERLQSLSPAIMHFPPPVIETLDSHVAVTPSSPPLT